MRPSPLDNTASRIGLIILHLAFAAASVLFQGCIDSNVTRPAVVKEEQPDPYGFSVSIPPTMPDRQGSFQLAAVADEYARLIEYDANRETPVLGTTADVDERLSKMAQYAFDGKNPATPEFIEVVKAVLTKQLETPSEGKELTPELRAKAAEIFRSVAQALRLK